MDNAVSLTQLIHRAAQGDTEAADRLFAAMYDELRRLARARLRAGGRNTLLDTSSLVHESYLRFASAGQLRLQLGGSGSCSSTAVSIAPIESRRSLYGRVPHSSS